MDGEELESIAGRTASSISSLSIIIQVHHSTMENIVLNISLVGR